MYFSCNKGKESPWMPIVHCTSFRVAKKDFSHIKNKLGLQKALFFLGEISGQNENKRVAATHNVISMLLLNPAPL
jgi:hypothetical protein